jgi:hypothetical protein
MKRNIILIAVLAILLSAVPAAAENNTAGATLIEQATVWSVRNFTDRYGYGYCTITLKVPASRPYIRYLTWVYGASCTAYPQGAAVTLVYDVVGKTKTLRTWY